MKKRFFAALISVFLCGAMIIGFSSCDFLKKVIDALATEETGTDAPSESVPSTDNATGSGSLPATEPATEPSTEPATEPATSEELPKEPEDYFELALDYEKDIIVIEGFSIDDLSIKKHVIKVPALKIDTDAAKDLNSEIYALAEPAYRMLVENREDSLIFLYNPRYTVYAEVAEIVYVRSEGAQFAGMGAAVDSFYFDIEGDRKITLDEFAAKAGIDTAALHSSVIKSSAYQNCIDYYGATDAKVTSILMDESDDAKFATVWCDLYSGEYVEDVIYIEFSRDAASAFIK